MTDNNNNDEDYNYYDVVIVGGGVVGLAILRAATLAGYRCAVVERDADLLQHASGSNSGIACTGVDASPGTLERALIREANSVFRIFCRDMNVPMRPCGSLVCLWPWNDSETNEEENYSASLEHVLSESLDAGDAHARRVSSDEVLQMEPHLNASCRGAVHIPGEIVVDPWLYSIALAVHARQNGATIRTNFEMDPAASYQKDGIWTIVSTNEQQSPLRARAVVNATGLWSDQVQTSATTVRAPWTAKPRRGQYRVYQGGSTSSLTHPIQPIPTQRTKGIFVFSSLYDQIAVGPTALDQSSRTDRSVDPAVSQALAEHARRILPALNTDEQYVGDYVGIRPGTDLRDYQIHLDASRQWVACAGIRSTGMCIYLLLQCSRVCVLAYVSRSTDNLSTNSLCDFFSSFVLLNSSTGLTASLAIGRHVVHLLQQGILAEPASQPDSKDAATTTTTTTPLPDISDLVDDFLTRGDGCVELFNHSYKVTHPLTIMGWKARTGLASSNKAV